MSAETIRFRVDPETARAYREASEAQRARARSVFALALRVGDETVEETIRVFDEVARNARARGLTPDILDDILNDRPPSPAELAGGIADDGE